MSVFGLDILLVHILSCLRWGFYTVKNSPGSHTKTGGYGSTIEAFLREFIIYPGLGLRVRLWPWLDCLAWRIKAELDVLYLNIDLKQNALSVHECPAPRLESWMVRGTMWQRVCQSHDWGALIKSRINWVKLLPKIGAMEGLNLKFCNFGWDF